MVGTVEKIQDLTLMYPYALSSQMVTLEGQSRYARSFRHQKRNFFESGNQHTSAYNTRRQGTHYQTSNVAYLETRLSITTPSSIGDRTKLASSVPHLISSTKRPLGRSAGDGAAVLA